MSVEGKAIRKNLKDLESKAELVDILREIAKTEGGRLDNFGREIVGAGRRCGIKQAFIADLLGISSGAVSQHYNR